MSAKSGSLPPTSTTEPAGKAAVSCAGRRTVLQAEEADSGKLDQGTQLLRRTGAHDVASLPGISLPDQPDPSRGISFADQPGKRRRQLGRMQVRHRLADVGDRRAEQPRQRRQRHMPIELGKVVFVGADVGPETVLFLALFQQPAESGLTAYDHARLRLLAAMRQKACELNRVAQSLVGVNQQPLAGDRSAVPFGRRGSRGARSRDPGMLSITDPSFGVAAGQQQRRPQVELRQRELRVQLESPAKRRAGVVQSMQRSQRQRPGC